MTEAIDHVRRFPGPALLCAAIGVFAGVILGALLLNGPAGATKKKANTDDVVLGSDVPALEPSSGRRVSPRAAPPASRDTTQGIRQALDDGVGAADALGGTAAAAVQIGDSEPVTVGPASSPIRLWSVSKAVTGVALFRTDKQSPAVDTAIAQAITSSENCPQRVAVLALQSRMGGADGAANAFAKVLTDAGAGGASVSVAAEAKPLDPSMRERCRARLEAAIPDPFADAPQFGIARWTVRDGATFAAALSSRRLGEPGERVRTIMARPKVAPNEGAASDFTADPSWGAGKVLPRFQPAYKAGWGGATSGTGYSIAQVISIRPGGTPVGVSVAFRPNANPASDDPGKGNGTVAVETVLQRLLPALDRLENR